MLINYDLFNFKFTRYSIIKNITEYHFTVKISIQSLCPRVQSLRTQQTRYRPRPGATVATFCTKKNYTYFNRLL